MSRASRDTILGWTKSGAPRLLLEFQRAWACCEEARDEPFGGLDVLVRMGSVPRVTVILGSVRAGHPRPLSRGRRRRWHAVSARVNERAPSGTDRVMARAAVEGRGRPRGSRFPFGTADSASAKDRRRPEVALA